MIKKDYLLKVIDRDGQFRATIANSTNLVQEAHQRHNTSATASAALGRVLTGALMMGSDLKNADDSLTLRINGNGISGPIIATVDSKGNGRGLISNPCADLPSRYPGKLAVGEIVGREGFLEVIKDLGLKQPFIGRVPLVSGEIAEDLAKYFLMSEQIPSLISLGVLISPDLSIKSAGGLFIQALPGADDRTLEKLESQIISLGPISNIMNEHRSVEEVLAVFLQGFEYRIIKREQIQFKCTCNRVKLAGFLASLSVSELESIYAKIGKLEITCNFCNEVYDYSIEEIKELKK